MNVTDKIANADFVYSTLTKWGLKKYTCDVLYFTEEPLDDLYDVVCSILATNDGFYDNRSLGVLLGFSMMNQEKDGKPDVYFDIAEVRMFEDILKKVEDEHLIKVVEHDVILTNLGKMSLEEKKHYKFFSGTKNLFEHQKLKSDTPTALSMFPFFKDMGIYSDLVEKKQIWPDDESIDSIIHYEMTPLLKRLEYQSKEKANIYQAEQQEYFDLDSRKVAVKVYQDGNDYIPVIMNGDDIAIHATELVSKKENALFHENLVLECFFQKLWDDKDAILNDESLHPYYELVDYEKLTKDNRVEWSDDKLMAVIINNAIPTCWKNISRFCDIKVLYSYIPSYKGNLDWPILTERAEDQFLIDHFIDYPWDLEVLSSDFGRNIETIEQLLLQQKDTQDEWNWEELEKILPDAFVLSNLSAVQVNLARYTKNTVEVQNAVLSNPDKRWDWNVIETEFPIEYLYDNLDVLQKDILNIQFFDRIFTDATWGIRFATNDVFINAIKEASKDEGSLSSCILNDKDYIWNPQVIDALTECGLISWPSTPYMVGFECNQSITWNKQFFDKYAHNITTDEGRTFISKSISDLEILSCHSDFEWDWQAISSNNLLLQNPLLYSQFGKKLDWKLVFDNNDDIEQLQSIDKIDAYIGDDEEAWTKFSSVASLDYVIAKYKEFKYPWDWTVLTERMFSKLKLENLGNPLFVEKWDWTYLSENIPTDFLFPNLDKFKNYWNWNVIFGRIINESNKFDYNFLDKITFVITNITPSSKCKEAWTSFTSQYSFKELKKVLKETSARKSYWWDLKYFCLHKEFNVFSDIHECRNFVDWKALSSSEAVDDSLKFNPKLKIKPKSWTNDVMTIIADTRNKWDFKLLSSFKSLNDQRWFLSRFKDKIDWEVISKSSKLFCQSDKQKLNEIIESYKDRLDFKVLSERDDVNIEQIIKINPKGDYDYNALMDRHVIKVTMELVDSMPNYSWDWFAVSSSKSFYPTKEFLLDKINEDLNWPLLSTQDNKRAWESEEVIISIAQRKNISDLIDWKFLSGLQYFPISKRVLEYVLLDELDWSKLSGRKDILPLIVDYADYINWSVLSEKIYFILDFDTLKKYKDRLDWHIVCQRKDFVFTNDILEQFCDYIDWTEASSSLNINFTKALVLKYTDKWNWPVLVKNKAFHNKLDISQFPYGRQINVVDFIDRFPCHPKAYHFTHMDNALKIIRSMKLQCRNYADGNFSNSAGVNVNRTNKAHRFARFYFTPKSPTQFYNECLGKDMDDRKYYERARRLGLPKCPMPVFFVFDIEELLMTIPEKCYYSTGNMQKDASRWYRIIDDPSRIKAREIYIDSYDTFDERQQEFLVDGELDFSKLKDVQICCYDDYQADVLRKEFEGTRWAEVVSVNRRLYEYQNKELYFNDNADSIRIYTNYKNPYEFRVTYFDNNVPDIVNKNMVLRQKDNNIYVSFSVEISKGTHFEVYFEVNNPRVGSWLIYKN
jgi:hypothetical protein